MSELIEHITDQEFESKVITGKGLILVDFWAPWCGPCLALAPILELVAKELENQVSIKKLNVDENAESAARFGISGIPTILLFESGKLLDQQVGVAPLPKIKEFITRHIK
jgi:thioredoxin 1